MRTSAYIALVSLPCAALLGACAPAFYDLPKVYKPNRLVERSVRVDQGVLEPAWRRELVIANTDDGAHTISTLAPVRWFPSTEPSRTQPLPPQTVAQPFREIPGKPAIGAPLPKMPGRPTSQRALFVLSDEWMPTEEANQTTLSFQADKNAVYEVRFLYDGPIDPIAAHETIRTWNALVQRLMARGAIRREQIAFASARYNQPYNAIALVQTDREVVPDD